MPKVDLILTGASVVTMDANHTLLTPGSIAVKDGSITAVGTPEEVEASQQAAERVDRSGCVIIPGLINAHTHSPMSLLRGLADDLRLDVWLMGYMMPVEREFVRSDFCWLGTQLACAEMIRGGTTCFGDMYYYEEAVADAAAQAGLRAVCAETVLRYPTPDALSYDESLQHTRDFIERWKGHELIVPAVGPHAPYTATKELLNDSVRLALEYDVLLHTHLAETAQEVKDHLAAEGVGVVQWLDEQGLFEGKVLAAHCVHLDEGELKMLAERRVGVAHCPTSNLKLASGIAPVAEMLELGVTVGIGTDGPASNNDLDMWEEMRLAALLAKGATIQPTVLPARQALEMATIGGARALHVDELAGSIEVGKRADLAVVDSTGAHVTPAFEHDPETLYSRLVYAGKASDVRDVLCQGEWLMRDRILLTLDEASLIAEAAGVGRKIDAFIIQREESVLSKLLAIAEVAQDKTFEVQVKVRLSDISVVDEALAGPRITVVKPSLRRQYDTYFLFDDADDSRLRYREDLVLDESGEVGEALYRLTLTTGTKEREYDRSVLLSRSRFDAPANKSLRFYREYFKPDQEIEVEKERRRYRVRYGGTDFAINLDRLARPELEGVFLEIKSRTWSGQDAERKAGMIGELLALFQVQDEELVRSEYMELASAG
jgi:5-methylthioadenosine/S-adenosylhomocysteine deaminase